MADITNQYYDNQNFVKCSVKQNYRDISQLNPDLRWKYDNRIAVAGWGMLNPSCDRYFRINACTIGYTDYGTYSIRKDGFDTGDYRNVRYAGAQYWIKD